MSLAGCGSGAHHPRAAPAPRLPRPLASTLAGQRDRVARLLGAGDSCAALVAAKRLRSETTVAVNRGKLPAALQERLSGTVNDLETRIRCVPPASPPAHASPPGKDKGKRGSHEKHKGGEGGD